MKYIYLLLLLSLFSCKKDNNDFYKSEKTYVIHKNWNEADYRTNYESRKFLYDMNFAITPMQDCIYNLESNDNYDINKFYGVSWGLSSPEKNSFRIGWNCFKQNGKIQWFYYVHNNGIRCPGPNDNYDRTYMFETYPGQEVEFYIKFNYWPGSIDITVIGSKTITIPFNFDGVPRYLFYCFPYFGGNNKAQHTMHILIMDRNKI